MKIQLDSVARIALGREHPAGGIVVSAGVV
jgi:hypothetical protein